MTTLEDNLPENYSLFLVGPPGVGKFEYCVDKLKNFLKNDNKVIYITTETSIDDIVENAQTFDLDLEVYSKEQLRLIDCYSWPSEMLSDKTIRIDNFSNLNEISVNIEEAAVSLGGEPIKIIFNSLSPLFLYNDTTAISRFVQNLTARAKMDYGYIFYTLQEGVHDPQTINMVTYFVDGLLEMKYDEVGLGLSRLFRVHHLKGIHHHTEWVEYPSRSME